MFASVIVQHKLYFVQLYQFPNATIAYGKIVQKLKSFANDLFASSPIFKICYAEILMFNLQLFLHISKSCKVT